MADEAEKIAEKKAEAGNGPKFGRDPVFDSDLKFGAPAGVSGVGFGWKPLAVAALVLVVIVAGLMILGEAVASFTAVFRSGDCSAGRICSEFAAEQHSDERGGQFCGQQGDLY